MVNFLVCFLLTACSVSLSSNQPQNNSAKDLGFPFDCIFFCCFCQAAEKSSTLSAPAYSPLANIDMWPSRPRNDSISSLSDPLHLDAQQSPRTASAMLCALRVRRPSLEINTPTK